jgi:hypothetical protein
MHDFDWNEELILWLSGYGVPPFLPLGVFESHFDMQEARIWKGLLEL